MWFRPINTRATLASKTGNVYGKQMRTAEPIGGTYMQDVAGTAQGNRFFPGRYLNSGGDVSSGLALATDCVDPEQHVIATGGSISGLNRGTYSFPVENHGLTNRRFSDVTADEKTYCYDNFMQRQSACGIPLGRPNRVLLLSMPSPTTLKAEFVAGASCAAASRPLTEAGTEFER